MLQIEFFSFFSILSIFPFSFSETSLLYMVKEKETFPVLQRPSCNLLIIPGYVRPQALDDGAVPLHLFGRAAAPLRLRALKVLQVVAQLRHAPLPPSVLPQRGHPTEVDRLGRQEEALGRKAQLGRPTGGI